MKNLKGVFTALITPMSDGNIDFASLDRLVDQQIAGGVDGFVVNGTTAESPTLEEKEVEEIFDRVRLRAPGKTLILGTGSNCTKKTAEATSRAKTLGADAALVVVPYYNKPPQRGLFQHFKTVAEASRIPVILYNVPGRTITALSSDTIRDLSKVPGIVGIKEATGDIELAARIRSDCGRDFILLSGDDGTYHDFLRAGGDGVISVGSHVIPKKFVEWTRASVDGRLDATKEDFRRHVGLIEGLFMEANPIPVKKALQLMGVIEKAGCRLPLVEMDERLVPKLREEMQKCGLL